MGLIIGFWMWFALGTGAGYGFWVMVLDRHDYFAAFLCAVVMLVASDQAGGRLGKWMGRRHG